MARCGGARCRSFSGRGDHESRLSLRSGDAGWSGPTEARAARACRSGCDDAAHRLSPRRTGRTCARSSNARRSSTRCRTGSSYRCRATSNVSDGVLSWDWDHPPLSVRSHPRSPLSFHVPAQATGTPFFSPDVAIVKFNSFWTIELEPGYSLFATHPINRADLPFRTLTGLVDCDRFTRCWRAVSGPMGRSGIRGRAPARNARSAVFRGRARAPRPFV